jgi:SAM-dependent methyltransferase
MNSPSSPRLNLLPVETAPPEVMTLDDLRAAAGSVAEALRMGLHVSDRKFDRLLPRELRFCSGEHWTPIEVAQRAAEWLDATQVREVVDIGSGPGKFCVAAALASRAHFTGVEHRARFVSAARSLATALGVENRVSFVHADFEGSPVPEAEAYYLYNPFGENLFLPEHRLDADVELSNERYDRDVAAVERMLRDAAPGTYVLTYNGFGGNVPAGFVSVRVDRELPCVLHLWRKARRGRPPS